MAKRRGNPESVAGFFRQLFEQRPELLKQKKNKEILDEYRRAHGLAEDAPVGKKVMSSLGNTKSVMRKQARKRGRKSAEAEGAAKPVRRPRDLESLEIMIDDAMAMARAIDKEQLADIWERLRSARNKVVLMMG